MPEGTYTVNFTVEVSKFGNSQEQAEREAATSLGVALNRSFGDLATFAIQVGNKERPVVFDPLAHDAEHEGHDVALKIKGAKKRRKIGVDDQPA